MNLQQAVDYATARLKKEEDLRLRAYNDATGKTVTCRPDGNLTIGYGTNLEDGLYQNESDYIFANRVSIASNEIADYWWFKYLDEVRASVFIDLCFNEGLPHLLGFVKTLTAVGNRDWITAHNELLNSEAAKKDPNRYQRLAKIILTGVNQ